MPRTKFGFFLASFSTFYWNFHLATLLSAVSYATERVQ